MKSLAFKVFLLTLISATGFAQAPPKSKSENIFDKKPQNQTEVFVASDVSKKVEQAVKDTLAVAVDTWGSSGRLEYWVLGTDRAAAVKLAESFCKRRVARGHGFDARDGHQARQQVPPAAAAGHARR